MAVLPRCQDAGATAPRTPWTPVTLLSTGPVSPRLAGERVGRVYYAGHPVLFAGAAEHLRFGESCLTLLEECLARIAPSHGVDAEADARRWAGEHVALWLDLARVDTLEATGEVLAAEHILSGRIATLEEVANGSFRVSIADTVPSVACPRRPTDMPSTIRAPRQHGKRGQPPGYPRPVPGRASRELAGDADLAARHLPYEGVAHHAQRCIRRAEE